MNIWGALAIGLGAIVAVPMLMLVVGAALLSSTDPIDTPTPVPSVVATTPTPEPPPEPTEPPTPTPTPPPPPPPEPEPEPIPDITYPPLPPPGSDDPAWISVQQAAIYQAQFPEQVDCPPLTVSEDMSELQAQTTAGLECVQAAWRPTLEGLGLPTATVPHFYYEGTSATSACGTMTGAPAFYCSANGGAIYFGSSMIDGEAIWAKSTVGHEFAHHLQAISGFVEARAVLPASDEIQRRVEIQAECIAVGLLRRDASVPQTRALYDALDGSLRNRVDDGIHGSPDSLSYWGLRAFHGDLVGECNTWVVDSEGIR